MGVLKELNPNFEYNFNEANDEQKKRGVLGVVDGTFQASDIKNANDRIYARSLWASTLKKEDIVDRLTNRAMVGELDHPQSGATAMSRISHVITRNELKSDGTVYGEAEILDTPMGRIAETLFRAGIRVGISSRGDGTVTDKGGDKYVNEDDYKLETYDFVLKPSTPGAYPSLSEEEQSQEDLRILEAVKSLVNESGDPRLLLESSKILSCLSCSDQAKVQQEALADRIQEKLVTIYETASSRDEPDPVSTENNMNLPANPPQPIDPHKIEELARDLAKSKVDEMKVEYEGRISELQEQITEMSAARGKLQKEYDAAESLVEELLRKVDEVKESAKQEGAEGWQTKYEAAKKLLEEALRRMQAMNESARKYQAAEALLVAMLEKEEEGRIENHVESLLTRVPEAQRVEVLDMLSECASIVAVDKMWENIKKIGGKVYEDRVQPLPGQSTPTVGSTTSLTEGEKTPAARVSNSLVAIANRQQGIKAAS